jgi:hypothetical protein
LSSSPVYSRVRETKGPKEEHLSSSPVYSRVRETKGPKEDIQNQLMLPRPEGGALEFIPCL